MAFWTRSEGGSGFSLEASLMASLMASSRSSSSMGFPGSYGAMPRMWALASEIQEFPVLPGAPLGGPRFDLGQVKPALGEGLQDAVEDARLVAHGEEDVGLVPSRGQHGPAPQHEQAGRVVGDGL